MGCCGSGAVARQRLVTDRSAGLVLARLLGRDLPINQSLDDQTDACMAFRSPQSRYIGDAWPASRAWPIFADRSTNYGAGVADGDAEPDPVADGEGEAEGEGDGDGDGVSDTAGIDGSGIGVGSGTKRDGTPRIDSTITSTKIAMTARIHGRARRSCRVGRAPR